MLSEQQRMFNRILDEFSALLWANEPIDTFKICCGKFYV